MKMKKIVMTMIAALTMTAAMAQQSDNQQRRAPRKMDAQQMTERMAKELGLDDSQKAKVLELNKEYQDVLGGPGMGRGPRGHHHGPRPDSLRQQKTDGQTGASEQTAQRPKRPELSEEQKAEMKLRQAKREEYDQKLNAILTAEQQKKMKQMRKGRHGGRGPKAQQD
jgi:hypothetical protein